MMSNTKIILILISMTINPNLALYFPVSDSITWSPLDPSEIVCEHKSRTPEMSSSIEMRGYLPILRQDYKVHGYMCTKVTLSTKCEKHFFGGTDVTYIEQHSKIHLQECLDAIHEFISGSFEPVTYPADSCSWMSMTVESKHFIHVQVSEMLYDPYKSILISELFPKGVCDGQYCKTIYESRIWIPDQLSKPECISRHLDTVLFYAKHHGSNIVEFWSPDMNVPINSQICFMKYCGIFGLRFIDGSWIGLQPKDVPTIDSYVENYIQKLPKCNPNTTISKAEKHYTEHIAEKTLIEKFLELECEKTKSKLYSNEPISRVELQTLTPVSPGFHRVYRLFNGSIEMGLSEYREVSLVDPIGENPIIARTKDNKLTKWKYWTHDSRQNIYDGPNGLYYHNGKVYSHIQDISSYKQSLGLSLKLRIAISKPTIFNSTTSLKENEKYEFQHVSDKSLDEVVGESVSNVGHWFKKWIILGAILLLCIVISCCIINSLKSKLFKSENLLNVRYVYTNP